MPTRSVCVQILVNLLSNAIKYNRPQGRIMLEAMAVSPRSW